MPAPKKNKNAVGNKGGKPYSKANRKKAATLKGLVLDWALKILKTKFPKKPKGKPDDAKVIKWLSDTAQLRADRGLVINKILPTCVDRDISVSGDGDTPMLIINVGEKK